MEEVLAIIELDEMRWSWQVFVVVALTLLANFIATQVLKRLERRFQKTDSFWDDALVYAARTPVNILILVLGLSWAAGIGNQYMEMDLFTGDNLFLLRRLTIIFLVMFCLVRFINITEKRVIQNFGNARAKFGDNVDITTVSAIGKLLRLAVIISSLLVVLPTLGIEITALLAFGGVGGIAIGFAAKDLLANFFGGLIIYFDRPFAIGEWIRSPDRNIEGTVEKIGWRVTLVRTFDKRPLYIPNAVFTSIALENPSRMLNRRIFEHMGIRYSDIGRMESVVTEVREMLRSHPEIDTNQTLMVNFTTYGASSLDFFIYTFTRTTNWVEFHAVKQDVLLKTAEIVLSNGAEFAFPTTTVDGLESQLHGLIAPVNEKSGSAASDAKASSGVSQGSGGEGAR